MAPPSIAIWAGGWLVRPEMRDPLPHSMLGPVTDSREVGGGRGRDHVLEPRKSAPPPLKSSPPPNEPWNGIDDI